MGARFRAYCSDKPLLCKAQGPWEIGGYTDMPESGTIPDEQARELIHGYAACVSYIDTLIGQVLAELERLGLAEDTIVMFWGDHGWKLGEHGAWCKHTNFEIDCRAPLMLRVPGHEGARTEALVEFVDMYPTLAELCGLPVPAHCEGRSLVPLLQDPQQDWSAAAFSQYPRGKSVMGYAMRTARYRYIEWRQEGEVLARELYDHQGDPEENRNLADRPGQADIVAELSAQLARDWPAANPALNTRA